MADITINEVRYRTHKLNAFEQIKVVKRIFPLISGLGAALGQMNGAGEGGMWAALGPMADAIAEMPDEASDFVIKTCLGTCQRYQVVPGEERGAWRPVVVDGHVMFDDIDMAAILQLTFRVLQENLGTFFPIPAVDDGVDQPTSPLN